MTRQDSQQGAATMLAVGSGPPQATDLPVLPTQLESQPEPAGKKLTAPWWPEHTMNESSGWGLCFQVKVGYTHERCSPVQGKRRSLSDRQGRGPVDRVRAGRGTQDTDTTSLTEKLPQGMAKSHVSPRCSTDVQGLPSPGPYNCRGPPGGSSSSAGL